MVTCAAAVPAAQNITLIETKIRQRRDNRRRIIRASLFLITQQNRPAGSIDLSARCQRLVIVSATPAAAKRGSLHGAGELIEGPRSKLPCTNRPSSAIRRDRISSGNRTGAKQLYENDSTVQGQRYASGHPALHRRTGFCDDMARGYRRFSCCRS